MNFCDDCRWREGCPTGQVRYGPQPRHCKMGIYEKGDPAPKPALRPIADMIPAGLLTFLKEAGMERDERVRKATIEAGDVYLDEVKRLYEKNILL